MKHTHHWHDLPSTALDQTANAPFPAIKIPYIRFPNPPARNTSTNTGKSRFDDSKRVSAGKRVDTTSRFLAERTLDANLSSDERRILRSSSKVLKVEGTSQGPNSTRDMLLNGSSYVAPGGDVMYIRRHDKSSDTYYFVDASFVSLSSAPDPSRCQGIQAGDVYCHWVLDKCQLWFAKCHVHAPSLFWEPVKLGYMREADQRVLSLQRKRRHPSRVTQEWYLKISRDIMHMAY